MGGMGPKRLFWRVFATIAAFGLVVTALLGVALIGRIEQRRLERIEGDLRVEADLIRKAVRGHRLAEARELGQALQGCYEKTGTCLTLLGGADLSPLSDAPPETDPPYPQRSEVRAAAEAEDGFGRARAPATRQTPEYLCVAQRTDDPSGAVAYVHLAHPLPSFARQAGEWVLALGTAAGLATLLALFISIRLARHVAEPASDLARAAGRIASGQHGQKVYAAGGDEVGQMARSFNRMSERLADQFEQLERDRQQLRAILSGMVEGVVALDAEGSILFANDRAAQLLEFDAQTAVGRRFWQVVRRSPLQEVVHQALSLPTPLQRELTWDGTPARSLTVHAARLPGPDWGRGRGAVLVLHDTSALRRLERHRQEFVANVSHELKTPLSVIKAAVETLLDGAADDPVHRGPFLDRIAKQADRLHALILDLLSLARIESGEEIFEFQDVAVGPVVQACLDRHRERAEAKGQRLEAAAPAPDDGTTAWADEEALSQILDNLVDNAVKYTPPGSHIRVRWEPQADQVCLEVEDDGGGIPPQDLPRIFERFYRVDKARSRELGGTGLGLSIVKHLVQAMRGSVGAASQLGHGTTFTVCLPRTAVS
jgi:two-component system phosphate regulon sensor histidine kinase PhoR